MTGYCYSKTDCGRIFLLLIALSMLISGAAAAEITSSPIPDALHVNINTANGAGYYIKFDGGGLNALHLTTSTGDPYGQLTTTSTSSGTFFVSDTGGRGFFNDIILMIAIRKPYDEEEPLPDNLAINIKSSGYTWTPTGVVNQPPAQEDLTYVSGAVDRKFTISSITYGPQKWKPAGNNDPLNYPIYGDQDMGGDEEFYIYFVDLKVGNLGGNSGLSGLNDEGMVRVEYSIENLDSGMIAFNAYGYCAANQANQGEGISWTNAVTGDSPSGYVVNLVGSGSSEGGLSDSSGRIHYDSDDLSPAGSWRPKVGNLNISSSPEGAVIYIDGTPSGRVTNCSFEDLPAGEYLVQLELEEYEKTDPSWVTVRSGYVTEEEFILTRGTGSCFVTSVPKGADIYIDGNDTLWHTDSVLHGITSGNHSVTVYMDGYGEVSGNVTVRMDQVSTLSFEFNGSGEENLALVSDFTGISGDQAPAEWDDHGSGSPGEKSGDGEDFPASVLTAIMDVFFGHHDPDMPSQSVNSGEERNEAETKVSPLPSLVPEDTRMIDLPVETSPEKIAGRLYVTSYPDGLPITIDGKKTDYKTPKMFYGLKEGFHEVSVSGMENPAVSVKKDVWVSSQEDTAVHLKPGVVDEKFTLTVDSKDFRDCSFIVGGKYPGYAFPSEVSVYISMPFLTILEDGRYYSCYVDSDWEGSVLKVERNEDFGIIKVYTKPEGAKVFIDSHDTGYTTPCSIGNVSGGYHLIKVSKDGHFPQEKVLFFVNTKDSIDSELRFVLEEYPYGNLLVDSTPQGAMIYLREVYTGMKTPYTFSYLPIGTYEVEVLYNRTVYKTGFVTVEPWERNPLVVHNVTLDDRAK